MGNIEFIPVPYVTENTRVNILLPVQDTEIPLAMEFLTNYASVIMDRKEKTFLMIILLYQYNSESKGNADPFAILKNFTTAAASKYRNDDVKIAWLSIRLPELHKPLYFEDNKALNFALVDLALKKIGLDSLTLILDVYCNISVDFLNRVSKYLLLKNLIKISGNMTIRGPSNNLPKSFIIKFITIYKLQLLTLFYVEKKKK